MGRQPLWPVKRIVWEEREVKEGNNGENSFKYQTIIMMVMSIDILVLVTKVYILGKWKMVSFLPLSYLQGVLSIP